MKLNIERLYDATDNLINQQFYRKGQDLIIGRTPDIAIKISNSGQIIQKFKDLFNQNINLFVDGNYKQFLWVFKKIKGLTSEALREINKDLENKLEYLSDTDFDEIVTYTIVLSVLITRIRDLHFNASLVEIKRRVRLELNISDEKIQEVLDQLFMKNNKNVSILYNLAYLDGLAESFNYKKVAHICKIQKGKFINRIVKIILSKSL